METVGEWAGVIIIIACVNIVKISKVTTLISNFFIDIIITCCQDGSGVQDGNSRRVGFSDHHKFIFIITSCQGRSRAEDGNSRRVGRSDGFGLLPVVIALLTNKPRCS